MNRNRKKRILATLLSVVCVFVLLLTGCGRSGSQDVSGSYTATWDITDMLNSELEDGGFSLTTPIEMDVLLDLNSDNTYLLNIDEDAFSESLRNGFTTDIDSITEQMMSSYGVSEDQYEEVAQAAGYDDYAALKEDLLNEFMDLTDELMEEEFGDDALGSGTWESDGSTITLNDDDGSVDTATIESDGSLTISGEVIDDMEVTLTFVKNS